jgi:pseudouridine synthase
MLERLQKILSARGIASRRKAEEYITAGLVKVNGKVAKLGDKADTEVDTVEVDGQVMKDRQELFYFLMNKPVGVVTSNVERWEPGKTKLVTEGQKRALKKREGQRKVPQPLQDTTVRDLLPKELQGKVYPIGRLDKESGGLLLLTNDGPLAFRLTHPKFDHEKEYEVEVDGVIPDEALYKMAKGGMMIEGSKTKPATIKRLGPSLFRITLTEGRNRQIRRMCEKVGFPVEKLTRVRIMSLRDGSLAPGVIRPLTPVERKALLHVTGLNSV